MKIADCADSAKECVCVCVCVREAGRAVVGTNLYTDSAIV